MESYKYVPVEKINSLSRIDLINWIRENVVNGSYVYIVCSCCGRIRTSPNQDVSDLEFLEKCDICDKEYLAYDVFVGIPGEFCPRGEKNILVIVKNDQNPPLQETDKRVVDYVENKFPDKKVLNIGIREEDIIIIQ